MDSSGRLSLLLIIMSVMRQCLAYYTLYDLDSNQAQMVLNEHNRLRAQEPAANMQEMVWNSELAVIAKDWVSRCAAMHRPGMDRTNRAGFGVIGENIWWSTETYLRSDLASVVRSLYDEKPFYSYSNNWCQPGQMCGHYTQVVWANTCAVGCAAAYCDYIYNGRGITSGHMVVCNYGPAGNYLDQWPYVYGSQCASCPGTCRNGLCPSMCAAGSWLPQAPAPPPPSISRPSQIAEEPPQTVTPFKPAPTRSAVRPSPQPAPIASVSTTSIDGSNSKIEPKKIRTKIISNACINQHPICNYWGSTGECDKNRNYMMTFCRATCDSACATSQPMIPQPRAATPSPPPSKPALQDPSNRAADNTCVDGDILCEFWAKTGECDSNNLWMINNCYASCRPNECGGKKKNVAKIECRDEQVYCNFWATAGECNTNLDFMQWQCRLSCALC